MLFYYLLISYAMLYYYLFLLLWCTIIYFLCNAVLLFISTDLLERSYFHRLRTFFFVHCQALEYFWASILGIMTKFSSLKANYHSSLISRRLVSLSIPVGLLSWRYHWMGVKLFHSREWDNIRICPAVIGWSTLPIDCNSKLVENYISGYNNFEFYFIEIVKWWLSIQHKYFYNYFFQKFMTFHFK